MTSFRALRFLNDRCDKGIMGNYISTKTITNTDIVKRLSTEVWNIIKSDIYKGKTYNYIKISKKKFNNVDNNRELEVINYINNNFLNESGIKLTKLGYKTNDNFDKLSGLKFTGYFIGYEIKIIR